MRSGHSMMQKNTQILNFLVLCLVPNLSWANPFVGHWGGTEIEDPKGDGPSVGWEIEFRKDGSFHLLEDGGMQIQIISTGRYSFDSEHLNFHYDNREDPWVAKYLLKNEDLTIIAPKFLGWQITVKKNAVPVAELHELPTRPKSLKEAVDLLISEMSEEYKNYVQSLPEDELIQFHFGFGLGIRNRFGLWGGNYDLLESCGSRDMHPDDASGVIIHAVWRELQASRSDHREFAQLLSLYNSLELNDVRIRNLTAPEVAEHLEEAVNKALLKLSKDPDSMNVVLVQPDIGEEIPKHFAEKVLNTLTALKVWGRSGSNSVRLNDALYGFNTSLQPPSDIEVTPQYWYGWFSRQGEKHLYRSIEFQNDSFDMVTEISDRASGLSSGFPGVYRSSDWSMAGVKGFLNVADLVSLFRKGSDFEEPEKIMEISTTWYSDDYPEVYSYKVSSYIKAINDFKPGRFDEIGHLNLEPDRRYFSRVGNYEFGEGDLWLDLTKALPLDQKEIVGILKDYLAENFDVKSSPTVFKIILNRVNFSDHWIHEVTLLYKPESVITNVRGFVTLDGKVIPFLSED